MKLDELISQLQEARESGNLDVVFNHYHFCYEDCRVVVGKYHGDDEVNSCVLQLGEFKKH